MAVYKRGYRRYQGALTTSAQRFFVLPRFSWARLLDQRLMVVLLVLALFWPLVCAIFIYLANHADLLAGLDRDLRRFIAIDGTFFLVFMNVQAVFAIVISAFAGPSLVAPDLANNALPLYFSRPFTRADYLLSRMTVLLGLLSPVTWIPGLLLFAMQTGMGEPGWFTGHWNIGLGILAGFGLLILLVSLVALASSAYVKWRIIAGALVLAFFFVLAGVAEMVNAILRVTWGAVLNPVRVLYRLWASMLGASPPEAPSIEGSLAMLAVLTPLLLWILNRKLRPVEVIS